jgi:hypothetical protein
MLRSLVQWLVAPSDAVEYTEAAARLRTFDLVYFFSLARPMNYVIWLFGGKPFTHMGMLVVDPRDNELYVLESVAHRDCTPDVLCQRHCVRDAPGGGGDSPPPLLHNGVRLVSLRTRMLDQSSNAWLVWVQRLHMSDTRRAQCAALLGDFMHRVDAMHYEQRPSCIALAPLNAPPGTGDSEDTTSYYCSELVAAAYRSCGLSAVANVSNVWHSAFLDREPGLLLQHGAALEAGGFYIRRPPPEPRASTVESARRARSQRRLRSAATTVTRWAPSPLAATADSDDGDEFANTRSLCAVGAPPLVVEHTDDDTDTPVAAASVAAVTMSASDARALMQSVRASGVRIPYAPGDSK